MSSFSFLPQFSPTFSDAFIYLSIPVILFHLFNNRANAEDMSFIKKAVLASLALIQGVNSTLDTGSSTNIAVYWGK